MGNLSLRESNTSRTTEVSRGMDKNKRPDADLISRRFIPGARARLPGEFYRNDDASRLCMRRDGKYGVVNLTGRLYSYVNPLYTKIMDRRGIVGQGFCASPRVNNAGVHRKWFNQLRRWSRGTDDVNGRREYRGWIEIIISDIGTPFLNSAIVFHNNTQVGSHVC